MELLPNSRMKAFRACQRLHHYSYVLGVKPLHSSPAAAFGTIIHNAHEAYWLARMAGQVERLDDWLDAATDAAFDSLAAAEMDPFARARAEIMLAGYTAQWNQRPAIDVLGVEVEFRLPLINPETGGRSPRWMLAGKLDRLMRLEDGRVAIGELKTSSEDVGEGSQYRTRLTLDGQVGQYFEGAESLGFAADVMVYDVIGKPGQLPSLATPEEKRKYKQPESRVCPVCKKKNQPPPPHKVAPFEDASIVFECVDGRITTDPGGALYANMRAEDETPDEYRDRVSAIVAADPARYFTVLEIHRLEDERDEYRQDVWQTAAVMRESARAGIAPKNPDACFRYGQRCDYLDVCLRTANIDDVTRFERVANVNPELAPADAEQLDAAAV